MEQKHEYKTKKPVEDRWWEEPLPEYSEPPKPLTPPSIDLQPFLDEAEEFAQRNKTELGMFIMKTANQWIEDAKKSPIPQMLFSEFWYEGELCILFADTNTGKSILAVQIADSISKGEAVPGFKLQAKAQPVVYLDFELFDKQFEARYSINYGQHYQFAPPCTA